MVTSKTVCYRTSPLSPMVIFSLAFDTIMQAFSHPALVICNYKLIDNKYPACLEALLANCTQVLGCLNLVWRHDDNAHRLIILYYVLL